MRNINSLRNAMQFKAVYKKGKSYANKYLVMYILPEEGVFRLGISVSKKVGNSVVRHRLARLIRESYLIYKDKLPNDCHMVVVARVASKDQGQKAIAESFEHLLKLHKLI